MRVLLTGGGTGGHIYPAIALAQAFAADKAEVLFVGCRGGLEERLVPSWDVPLELIAAAPISRKPSLSWLRTIWANTVGVFEAIKIARAYKPDVVIATGGYVSFPVVLAARLTGKPFIGIVEPNAIPGLTNMLLRRFAREVWGAFPGGEQYFGDRYVATGTPVRSSMRDLPEKRAAIDKFDLSHDRNTVLVVGGSQGARTLNAATAVMLAMPFPPDFQVLHLCGSRAEHETTAVEAPAIARGDARVIGYLDDPSYAYSAADFIVARSGASTLAELAAVGKPALLVPYPFATRDHQRHNAEAYAEGGAARVVADSELDADRLFSEISESLQPDTYGTMRKAALRLAENDAAQTILARVRRALAAK